MYFGAFANGINETGASTYYYKNHQIEVRDEIFFVA